MVAAYWWTHRPSQLAWFKDGGHLAISLHSSNETDELSQWHRHYDSTINSHWYYHHTTTVLRPFLWDHPGEPVPEENFWTLWCNGRLTEADTLTIRLGATSSGLSSAHLHHPWLVLVLALVLLDSIWQFDSYKRHYGLVVCSFWYWLWYLHLNL